MLICCYRKIAERIKSFYDIVFSTSILPHHRSAGNLYRLRTVTMRIILPFCVNSVIIPTIGHQIWPYLAICNMKYMQQPIAQNSCYKKRSLIARAPSFIVVFLPISKLCRWHLHNLFNPLLNILNRWQLLFQIIQQTAGNLVH